jgi:anti-sigma factor RsiW
MIGGMARYLWARLFSGRREITCREATDFLAAYLEGELDEPVRREFDLHLGVCAACRDYLEGYRKTVALGREACRCGDAEAKAEMPEDLVSAILNAAKKDADQP